MDYINAFWVGGLICALTQILLDRTKLMPGRIMVLLVCSGSVLGAFKIYPVIQDFAGAGASVPLLGFGNLLWKGVKEAVEKEEAESGNKAFTYSEKVEFEKVEQIPFEELMDKVQEAGEKLAGAGQLDTLLEIVENTLGANKKVMDCTPRQYDAVSVIYDELCDKIKELGIE